MQARGSAVRLLARAMALVIAATTLAGCASLADRIVQPSTQGSIFSGKLRDGFEHNNGVVRGVVVARGGNRIAYRIVPAADYAMRYTFSRTLNVDGWRELDSFHIDLPGHPQPVPTKGTVVFVHGWGDDHATMLPWAFALAHFGYRGILPDLRNFGQSDRAPAGYGSREALDVVDLLAALRARGDVQGPVYLLGVSLGADVAVLTAADPSVQADGVIAMEPYVNADKGIRAMIRFMGKRAEAHAGILAAAAVSAHNAHAIDSALAEANRRLGLELDRVDIGPALRTTHTCTLLVQGAHDGVFDPADLRAFADLPHIRYHELPRENHFSLAMRADWLADPYAAWFAQVSACPALTLPPDPLEAPASSHPAAPALSASPSPR